MNYLPKILLFFFMILSSNVFGQGLQILNTKDLIKISEEYGLDSALNLTGGIPVYYLDKSVSRDLVAHTQDLKPSDQIERFLVDYALHVKDDKNIPQILNNYFEKKRNYIKDYQPEDFGGLPRISEDVLFALIENPTNKTDSLLIGYYNAWFEKSKNYEADYLKGKLETNSRKKEKLMASYEDCSFNCYVILLALDSLGSRFFEKNTLEYHQKHLKYYWQDGFGIHESGDFTDYNVNSLYKAIELKNSYNSIGEIEFNKEPELKDLFSRYDKSYCWKFVMYNEKTGYIDLGCQSAPLAGDGVLYRIELSGNKLIIHEIQSWIS